MYNLIRKDFLVLKRQFLLMIPYVFFVSIAFLNMRENLFLIGVYTAFILLMMGTGIDIKNKNHHFLATLPLRRKDIITAKYGSAIIYAVFGTFVCYLINIALSFFAHEAKLPFAAWELSLTSFTVVIYLSALYLPLFYWLSDKGAQIINIVFFVILIGISSSAGIVRWILVKKLMIDDAGSILTLAFLGSLVLLGISYLVCVRIFARKDV